MAIFDNILNPQGGARPGTLRSFLGAPSPAQKADERQLAALKEQEEGQRFANQQALQGILGEGPALPFGQQDQSGQIDTLSQVAESDPFVQQLAQQQLAGPAQLNPIDQYKLANEQLKMQSNQLGIEEQMRSARVMEETGGRGIQAHTNDVRAIAELGFGLQQVGDLRVMNQSFGVEKVPGGAKGTYETKRTFLINMMGALNDAGAMSAEEIKFYSGYIPDFTSWSSWSSEQRDASLRIVEELMTRKGGILAQTTQGQQAPQVQRRPLFEIMGEPEPPPGAEPVQTPSIGEAWRADVDKKLPGAIDMVKQISGLFGEGFSRSRGP